RRPWRMTDVTLSWAEYRIAMHVGDDRFVRNSAKGRLEQYDVDNPQSHSLGEYAVAIHADYCWRELGRPDRNGPDVGPLHVRTTTRDHGLRIYPNDPD